jgi:hypothetical protein
MGKRRYRPSAPRPNTAAPTLGGRFMTTNPARSRWSTRRFATIAAMNSPAFVLPLAAVEAECERQHVGDIFGRN